MYNGFNILYVVVFYVAWNLNNFLKLLEYNALYSYNRLLVNDSLIILYLLSSVTLTLTVLFMLICGWYIFSNKKIYVIKYWIGCIHIKYFITACPNALIFIIFNTHSINTNLQNGLLNMHPPIIYYIYSFTLFSWISLYSLKKNNTVIMLSVKTVFIICLIGVLLGALWAAQELNWGGFWSWDPVELVSLVLFNYLLYIFHFNKRLVFYRWSFVGMLMIVFLMYSIIRLGVINTVHSFIRANNIPIYVYYITSFMFGYILFSYKGYIHMKYEKHRVFSASPWKNWTIKNSFFFFIKQMLLIVIFIVYYSVFCQGVLNQDFLNINLNQMLWLNITALFYYVLVQANICILFWSLAVFSVLCNQSLYYVSIVITALILVSYTYRYKLIHNVFVLLLLISHIYFVNLNAYTSCFRTIMFFTHALSESIMYMNMNFFYENSIFLKKHFLFLTLKRTNQHLTGFNLLSNFNLTIYFFIRNFKVNLLFINELILILCYIAFVFGLNIFTTHNVYKWFINNLTEIGKYKKVW